MGDSSASPDQAGHEPRPEKCLGARHLDAVRVAYKRHSTLFHGLQRNGLLAPDWTALG